MAIHQLAPDVAAKIAAGEVVERPASVVKELIENSIDAGATQIRVDLVHGGLQLIRVSDNGCGIAADELALALSRHATSKVTVIDDLEHIRSLGFRGEALASIAAVAEVTLLSRARDSEQGAQIGAMNGVLSSVMPAATPQGTTLTVRNLFSAVPARLKFLKSRNTEIGHCHHLLEQYALAYPEIRFSVFSEGRQIFATPGDGQLASVLVEVYGLQVAEQMVAVSDVRSDATAEDAEYPVVSGYVSRPTCYKSTRQHISFFVNRRWVLSRMLTSAVDAAYKTLLLTGRHPIAVINIQVDPTLLDVNVHPAKTEIRFLKERRVFAAILRAVRTALLEEPEMPSWNPHKDATEDASGTARARQVTPSVLSAGEDEDPLAGLTDSLDAGMALVADQSGAGAVNVAPTSATPSLPQDNPWLTYSEEESGSKPPPSSRLWQSHIRGASTKAVGSELQRQRAANQPADISLSANVEPHDAAAPPAVDLQLAVPPQEQAQVEATQEPTTARIGGLWMTERAGSEELWTSETARHLPHLRVIGQLSQSYIVTEGETGLYLIDQHAAHERILLERMIAALKAHDSVSQLLLTPMSLPLAPTELEAVEDHLTRLEQIGFSLEIVDGKTLEVQAVPGILAKRMNAHSLYELLLELTAAENLGNTETWEERALANVACKAAIKQNYFLTVSEMREMLEQLEQTKAPYSCCHGRPTMVHFSLSALEREFGRR